MLFYPVFFLAFLFKFSYFLLATVEIKKKSREMGRGTKNQKHQKSKIKKERLQGVPSETAQKMILLREMLQEIVQQLRPKKKHGYL